MSSDDGAKPRRDFIVTAAWTFVAGGAGLALWPFISQFGPSPAAVPPEILAIDLTTVAPGQTIIKAWRNQPVVVRHRRMEEIARVRAVDVSTLNDRRARNAALGADAPASDQNRSSTTDGRWLVVIGVCTKEGCVVREIDGPSRLADGIGWFCPCCASRYDFSGRVLSGPAPHNLTVPALSIRGNDLRVG